MSDEPATTPPADRECPQAKHHGNPFRYCPCGWMEESAQHPETEWDANARRAVWDALTQAVDEITAYATAKDGAAGVVRILRHRLIGTERP